MLKSYFTIALRVFLHNKVTSFINIGGLTLGLTTGIVICLFMVYAFGFNTFHANYKAIHLVEMNQDFAGTTYTGGLTPSPLGPALRSEVPGVKYVVRSGRESETLTRNEEKAIYQKSIYAEPDLFRMMTFPAVQGDPVAALGDGGSVVLTQTAAQRLFGSRPALGKTIVLNNIYPLKVGAVIRDVPRNSSIEFDLVLPYALFEKDNELANHWEKRYVSTWVQLAPGARLETVNREMTLIIGTIFGYRQINYVADRPLGYETATAGLSLVEGRDFSPAFGTDSSACLINQAAVRKMNLKEPVLGARIYGKTVIGVLRDFVYNSPGKAIEPLIVWLGKVDLGHFLIRLANDGQCKVHLDQIGKTAKSLNPGYPFAFRFVNDEHQDQFKKDFGVMQLGGIFAFMAILISCLGLYGLASFLVEQRTREISIRKVLGASGRDLWLSLCSEMLKPVVLGFVVASPLTALAMYPLLSTADYHIPLSWWVFALAGAGTVLIALATVSYHGLRATRVNPARTLQNE